MSSHDGLDFVPSIASVGDASDDILPAKPVVIQGYASYHADDASSGVNLQLLDPNTSVDDTSSA